MRTTVDVPDPLFRQMKSLVALRGSSLKEFIVTSIQKELMSTAKEGEYTVELPLIRSKHPGALSLTNAEIEDLLA